MCVRCTTPAAGITRSALCQCCSQRVLEGEKAMRSEAAHRLREVEAQLAARRGAGGGRLTPPDGSPSEEKLLAPTTIRPCQAPVARKPRLSALTNPL